jgi:hypothetical protein
MARHIERSFDAPDETRTFDKGRVDVVKLEGQTVGRINLEPGWKWSECVKPIVGTESCQGHHIGYVLSGTMHVVMDDGDEFDGRPGEAYEIQPGHDAWVTGDDRFSALEFESKTAANYAKS